MTVNPNFAVDRVVSVAVIPTNEAAPLECITYDLYRQVSEDPTE